MEAETLEIMSPRVRETLRMLQEFAFRNAGNDGDVLKLNLGAVPVALKIRSISLTSDNVTITHDATLVTNIFAGDTVSTVICRTIF